MTSTDTRTPQRHGHVLAIVAPGFNGVSETFIAGHARSLAPGRTVLVCQDSRGAEAYGYPVLSHLQPAPTVFDRGGDRLVKTGLARLRRRVGPPLAYDDRMRVAEFFAVQGVTTVLAEYGPMGAMVSDICARLKLPLHVIFHGNDASALLRRPRIVASYRRMFADIAQAGGRVICVSGQLADNLARIGCPRDLIDIVPCGIALADFAPGTPEPGRILALGRLVEKKAPHLTIQAFGRIAARFPQARLDVVGDGPLRDACLHAVDAAGLGAQVTLHGSQPHAVCRDMLRRAAIFAQHSVTAADGDIEGSPVGVAEAMAVGLPVVSTRHSGIREQVEDGVNGYLVDEGDVDGMAEGMAKLLADPAAAQRMGTEGRARAIAGYDQARLDDRLRALVGLTA